MREGVQYAIDRPKVGPGPGLLDIRGWAFDVERPLEAVEIVSRDLVLIRASFDLARADVVALIPGAPPVTGFATLLGAVQLDPRFQIQIRAVRTDGSIVPLATISGTNELHSDYVPRIQPLMLTTVGRTGSTWLMRLLSGHPRLAMMREYPYEIRAAVYWLHTASVLGHPSDPTEHAIGVDPILPMNNPWLVARNPFFFRPVTDDPVLAAWFSDTYVSEVLGFAQRSIDEFYAALTASENRQDAAYFVEKFAPDTLAELATTTYPDSCEVILVRDFRDVVASMFAFDAKRGTRSFGRDRADDDQFLVELGATVDRLAWRAQQRPDRTTVVRYEDLVTNPQASLTAILARAGLDASPTRVETMISNAATPSAPMTEHQTAGSVEDSIGRWRTDLSPEMQAKATELFANSLAAFGYAA